MRDQRVEFVIRAQQDGQSLSGLCAEFGISRPTGYVWLRRYREQGVAGIEEHSRRPANSPRRTADSMAQRIAQLRRQRPDWRAEACRRVDGGARGDDDGSGAPSGWTQLQVWLMKQGIQCLFSGIRHPQTQGKVERFHLALEMARRRRGLLEAEMEQAWLDEFRHEYNHLRPHEALGMQVPASCWWASARRYDPHPPAWQYPQGAEVKRLGTQGQLKLEGARWEISQALAGEWVRLVRIADRILVYYCNSLLKEIDVVAQRCTTVPRWTQPNCKGCPDNTV